MPRRVGCHLRTVSAHLHAAPPPRAFLASVIEVQHTIAALADPTSIKTGEQRGSAVRNGAKQVLGAMRITVGFGCETIVHRRQPCPHRVLGQELVDFLNHPTLDIPADFVFQDFLPQLLAQLMQRAQGAPRSLGFSPQALEFDRLAGTKHAGRSKPPQQCREVR